VFLAVSTSIIHFILIPTLYITLLSFAGSGTIIEGHCNITITYDMLKVLINVGRKLTFVRI